MAESDLPQGQVGLMAVHEVLEMNKTIKELE